MVEVSTSSEVRITCRCGKVNEQVWLKTAIAVPVDFCHCNICRWTTGNLFYSALPLQAQPKCVAQLIKYSSSEKVSRYFCGTCGCHICHIIYREDSWHVASGVVDWDLENEQVFSHRGQQITEHQFVGDTKDGGLALCFTNSAQVPARFYMQAANGPAADVWSQDLLQKPNNETQTEPQLRAACHCAGVEFYLSRPNKTSREDSSPWPDLLRPYHSFDPANPDGEKWWIQGAKYLAGTCACMNCRLSGSTAITCWGFIPQSNLSQKDGSPWTSVQGTLQHYASSEGRTRGFCNVCGASVFLQIDERPELLDINLGLFRAREGARAESWFDWATNRVSFIEEGIDVELVMACESGLKHLAAKTDR